MMEYVLAILTLLSFGIVSGASGGFVIGYILKKTLEKIEIKIADLEGGGGE